MNAFTMVEIHLQGVEDPVFSHSQILGASYSVGDFVTLPMSVVKEYNLNGRMIRIESIEHAYFDQSSNTYPYMYYLVLRCVPVN